VNGDWLLDDFRDPGRASGTGTVWRCFTDNVMGGVSRARAEYGEVAGRCALCLRGTVSLENNGGFVQLALDLAPDGAAVDVSAYAGIAVEVYGDGAAYNLHLRSSDCGLPWQSYRATLEVPPRWSALCLPFTAFVAHRLAVPLNTSALRRIGLVAIGQARNVDIAIGRLALYRSSHGG
jgi:hypothetical protein